MWHWLIAHVRWHIDCAWGAVLGNWNWLHADQDSFHVAFISDTFRREQPTQENHPNSRVAMTPSVLVRCPTCGDVLASGSTVRTTLNKLVPHSVHGALPQKVTRFHVFTLHSHHLLPPPGGSLSPHHIIPRVDHSVSRRDQSTQELLTSQQRSKRAQRRDPPSPSPQRAVLRTE